MSVYSAAAALKDLLSICRERERERFIFSSLLYLVSMICRKKKEAAFDHHLGEVFARSLSLRRDFNC